MISKLVCILKNRSHQEIAVRYYKLVVKAFFILSVISFVTDPFGRLLLSYNKYSISSVTILTFSASILILMFVLEYVPPLPRILCSISLPVLGMSFHETLWHYGCLVVWGKSLFIFWLLYTVVIAVGTIVLHLKYNILRPRAVLVVVVLGVVGMCCYYWYGLTVSGFYQSLLLYEQGLGPNPHTPFHYVMASLGRMVWLLLAVPSNIERSNIVEEVM